jgi:hypothetical protein
LCFGVAKKSGQPAVETQNFASPVRSSKINKVKPSWQSFNPKNHGSDNQRHQRNHQKSTVKRIMAILKS